MSVKEQNRKRVLIGEDTNALTWLLILNALFYVGLRFVKVIYDLTADSQSEARDKSIDSWVALPADTHTLLTRPWTVLSYMFTHNSIWYLISSLLWLWCFGYILQDLAGNKKLFPVYLYGGFFGGLAFAITASLIPQMHANAAEYYLLGAGASVMAVAIAITTLTPDFRIFPMLNGGIPLWVLTLVFVAIDLSTIGLSNGAVTVAHIIGGFSGFFFVFQLKRGRDMGKWIGDFGNWVNDLFNPEKKHKQPPQQQLYYKATRKPFEKTHHFSQQKLDEILDKINEQGYHLLTEEEKEFLKKASKENF